MIQARIVSPGVVAKLAPDKWLASQQIFSEIPGCAKSSAGFGDTVGIKMGPVVALLGCAECL